MADLVRIRLLPTREVAERLGVDERTVRRRIEDGQLPAVKLGTARNSPLRVDERDLEQFLYGDPPREAA